jgi:MFS family permease
MRTSVLSYRDFRRLWTSSLFSYAGQWVQQTALGWVVYEITGSGVLLGAVAAVRAIPAIGLTPLAGVWADRYDRKKLLHVSQWLAGLTSAALGAALALDIVAVWMLFAFSLAMGIANVADRPARMTSVFELVPLEIAPSAVALSMVALSLSRVVAPAVAGYLIAWLGFAGCFFVQASLYFAAGAIILIVVFPARKPPRREIAASKELIEGLRFAVSDRTTLLLLLLGWSQFVLLVPTWGTLLPIYAKDVFDVGPQGLGFMLSAVGVGGILGGLIAGYLSRFDPAGAIQGISLAIFCAAVAGMAFAPGFIAVIVLIFIGGTAEIVALSTNGAILQLAAPEAMRGRIASLNQIYPGFIALGAFIVGPLSDLAGPRAAAAIIALASAVICALLFAASPLLRRLRYSQFR